MAANDDFLGVFDALRELMMPYTEGLVLVTDEPGNLYVDTHHIMKNKKPLFFGAVQTRKRYVSYHLMPVYVNPALLDHISDKLRKRMQGKSCLNFVGVDRALFEELRQLTGAGYDFYRHERYI